MGKRNSNPTRSSKTGSVIRTCPGCAGKTVHNRMTGTKAPPNSARCTRCGRVN